MRVLKNNNTIYSLENFRTIEIVTRTNSGHGVKKDILYYLVEITYADNKSRYIECGVDEVGFEMAKILIDKIYNILT